MKKVFLSLIILLITLASSAQDLQDTIITKAGDTINCEITFVNDNNIFYKYKKRKKLKSVHISRDHVLNYASSKIEKVSFDSNSKTIFEKCDTCENWMVTNFNDTIFYNLFIYKMLDDPYLIESVACTTQNSVSIYNYFDIKSMMWNGIEYTRISKKGKDIRYHISDKNLYSDPQNFLGYYKVKGKASLIEAGSIVTSNESGHPNKSQYIIKEYYVETDDILVYLRYSNKGHAQILRKVFKDNPSILAKIKPEGIDVPEMIELFKAYNKEAKEQ